MSYIKLYLSLCFFPQILAFVSALRSLDHLNFEKGVEGKKPENFRGGKNFDGIPGVKFLKMDILNRGKKLRKSPFDFRLLLFWLQHMKKKYVFEIM